MPEGRQPSDLRDVVVGGASAVHSPSILAGFPAILGPTGPPLRHARRGLLLYYVLDNGYGIPTLCGRPQSMLTGTPIDSGTEVRHFCKEVGFSARRPSGTLKRAAQGPKRSERGRVRAETCQEVAKVATSLGWSLRV